MTEVSVETEKYLFWVKQTRKDVLVHIEHVEKHRKIEEKDETEIKEFFKDMGKWETIVDAGKSLLADLGINENAEKEVEKEFGYEKYELKYERKEEQINVTIKLKPEESLRRTKGNSQNSKPSEKEIIEQIKNIQKWHKLKKSISELKALTNRTC